MWMSAVVSMLEESSWKTRHMTTVQLENDRLQCESNISVISHFELMRKTQLPLFMVTLCLTKAHASEHLWPDWWRTASSVCAVAQIFKRGKREGNKVNWTKHQQTGLKWRMRIFRSSNILFQGFMIKLRIDFTSFFRLLLFYTVQVIFSGNCSLKKSVWTNKVTKQTFL